MLRKTPIRTLTLYGGKDCCLCDQAHALLVELAHEISVSKLELPRFTVDKRDIYTDLSLLSKYRYHIPVLEDPESGVQLRWPFSLQGLSEWYGEIANDQG